MVRRGALLGLLLGAPDAASPRLIDTYVKSIRRKLGSAGRLIETVRGVGYRLASDRSPLTAIEPDVTTQAEKRAAKPVGPDRFLNRELSWLDFDRARARARRRPASSRCSSA